MRNAASISVPRVPLITPRLELRQLRDEDAGFIVELLNDPAFLEFIGDRGVRTEVQALEYIAGQRASLKKNGFALRAVVLRSTGVVTGLCGLVRRDSLPHADVGFAFLPAYRRQGYGREATVAVLGEAASLGIAPVLAICSPNNAGSRGLLEQVGFRFVKLTVLAGQAVESCLYER